MKEKCSHGNVEQGVTLACGTGATSTAISGFKLGLFDSEVLLHLPGGDLKFNVYEKKEKNWELSWKVLPN